MSDRPRAADDARAVGACGRGLDRSLTRAGLGHVTIVGAGPGSADLITVRGARALANADVVVHDRLCDPGLLAWAPAYAEVIDVGKCKGGGTPQAEINRLMVEHAGRGAHVVRLKGGDAFVFGRGAEEIDAVCAAGVPVSLVPGLTSALCAPALAGIAVTERGGAASVAVVSGHRADADGSDGYDWLSLARGVDTLVVLMAATTAGHVARSLLAAGLPPDHPVAAVHAAGTLGQRQATLQLGELRHGGCPFPAPTVLVIGVAALRGRKLAAARDQVDRNDHPNGRTGAGTHASRSLGSSKPSPTSPRKSAASIALPGA